MDNNTSCEMFVESQKTIYTELNITMKLFPYPGRNPEIWKTPETTDYIKTFAYVVIMIGGLLGNLSVILTVAFVKSIRNTINFYVANLAVSDAMICIVCMLPRLLAIYTRDKFVLGEFMCKFNPFTESK